MNDGWQYVMDSFQNQDWEALVVFGGVIVACILFICVQLLQLRSRRLAGKAFETARKLMEDMQAQERQLDELERRIDGRLDSRTTELDSRMTKKLDQKGDLIQERIDRRTSALTDSISKVESRACQASEEVARFREQLAEVERRIPGVFDKIEEFRETLGRAFQAELHSVLNSFDNSVTGVLQQMKSELSMGIMRIESIEGMVESRQRAEQTLLGLPEGGGDEGSFAEWEEEAKELEAAEDEEDEDEGEGLRAIPVEEPEHEPDEYPAEMAEEPGEDELDEALFAQELNAVIEEGPVEDEPIEALPIDEPSPEAPPEDEPDEEPDDDRV